jgi:WD40 repeat protein
VKFFTNDPLIRLWDVASGKETLKLESTEPAKPPFPDSRGFSALRFTPDGKSLVTTGPNSLVRFWDVKTGKEQRRFDAGVNGWALAFSPDGKTLAVASTEIRLFDVATGADASKVAGNVTIHYAYLTPDGRTVATLGGGRVTFWDAATGRMLGPAERSDETIIGLQILDGGRTLIGLSRDKALRVWDVKTRKETRRVRLPFAPSNQGHFALSPDGKIAAIQEEKRDALKLIDLASGREVGRLGEEKGGWYGLAFAPNGKSLIAWHADHFAQVWDVKTGKKVRQFEFLDHLPAGARLAGEGRRGLSYSAELSPDGRLLAYGSQRGYLALHDVTTGKCVRVVNGLPKGARAFGFSPDGRMLAWAGWFAPTIHLLEVATGAERYRLEGHKGDVWSLRFSRDGGTLVSTGADCTGLVWSVLGGTGKPDLDACWDDLGRAAEPAFRAMRRLAGSPPETVAYLGKRLRPIPTPDPKRLAGWIADLDNDSFDRRAAATKALQALGDAAAAACREALRLDPPLEARRRLEKLLAAVGAEEKDPSPERLRTLRSLELLEHVGSPAAREVLKRLAGGAAESWLTRQAKEGYERTAGR